mgnify:CR=1 FL=1
MRTMNIVLSPDPGLRQVCEPCQVGDKSLKKLAKQMLNTMYANNGCGLAAPQVGLNKRMVVIDCYDGPNETSNPLVLINPEVIEVKGEKVTAEEGCLSLPGISVPITRNEISRVRFYDLDGKVCELESDGLLGRCFQHEIDHLNGITLSPKELIEISKEAENKYVGVSCGKLDQSCEVYCRKDNLLYMDMQDDSYELIPASPSMKPFAIAIFFSGLERSLASSKFNMRVDECRSAAYALKAFAGMEYGKFEETNLRDVPYEVYLRYRDKLPENWARRAEHWYSEFQRVEAGAEAWRRGDIETFGRLSFESGYSSIHNWETGSPELIRLYEIMTQTDGIYGGRFSGAGFKGCCMALIDPAYESGILEKVEREYLAAFPKLAGKYSAHICHSADGVLLPFLKER